jgi:hypothetical protein
MTTGTTTASEQKIRQRSTVAWVVGLAFVGLVSEARPSRLRGEAMTPYPGEVVTGTPDGVGVDRVGIAVEPIATQAAE